MPRQPIFEIPYPITTDDNFVIGALSNDAHLEATAGIADDILDSIDL